MFYRLIDCLELLESMEEKGILDMNNVIFPLYTKTYLNDSYLVILALREVLYIDVSGVSCKVSQSMQKSEGCSGGTSFH